MGLVVNDLPVNMSQSPADLVNDIYNICLGDDLFDIFYYFMHSFQVYLPNY